MQLKKLIPASMLVLAACTASSEPAVKGEAAPSVPSAHEMPAATAPTAAVPTASKSVQGSTAALTPIADPSTVCMVNDQHMGVAQIPVQVEGKTYYGCCQMCEAKLKQNEQVRLGKDPVTQNAVDKATAVLAMDAKGKVLYFESEESMRSYAARL